jgi:hypothetical protein
MESRYYVFYERQKSNGQYAIYYRKAQTASYSWSVPDTFAYIGDNRNAKTISSYSSFESFCFESNRSGKWGLYQTYWDFYYSRFTQSVIIQNNTSEHRNFASQLYPVIAEGTAMLGSYVRQDNDSTRICSGTNIPVIVFNTFAVGDTLKKPLITISNGIPTINSLFRVWMVYNKDSAGYSMLYANGKRVGIFGNINKIGGEIPLTFSLSQNFPNPFNPETNIRFELPRDAYIKLQIFNILGNEIEIIVNKKLSAGSYIVNWNAVTKPNGIYFCKMTVDNTLCFVKKMILIK